MNRRNFLTTAGLAAGAAALPNYGCSMLQFSKQRYALGYQLYSIRDRMEADPLGTLKALKGMGYDHGEVYGFDSETGLIFGVTPSELQAMMSDVDLAATSGHYNFAPLLEASDDDMRRYVDACLACAKTLTSDYLVWPLLKEHQRTLDHYHKLVDKLNLIGEQLEGSGVGLAYHNHGYEFEDQGGQSGYDLIINDTDESRVKLQLDMYWLAYDPQRTPRELINANPGRYVMWHIKDMDKVSRDYTELGNGSIDYTTYLPDAKTSGLQYLYLEQGGNYTVDSLASAEASARYYLKNLRAGV